MTMPDVSRDFEDYARTKPMRGSVPENWRRAFSRSVAARLATDGTARALDYGFGDGRFFDVLADHFPREHVHGVEVSQIRTERAQARGWDNARFVAPGSPLPYPDAWFDFVNMFEVLEHIPGEAIDPCLAGIARVLKPSGTLLLTTPNYPIKRVYDVLDAVRLGQWKRLHDDPTHVSFFGHRRLHRALVRHFTSVTITPFKEGLFYTRTGWPPLCHKILADCRNPPQGPDR